jgi:hypothetical protein
MRSSLRPARSASASLRRSPPRAATRTPPAPLRERAQRCTRPSRRGGGVVNSRSAVLWERWHHLGGETLHTLPGFAAANQHISDADRLRYLQSRDERLRRAPMTCRRRPQIHSRERARPQRRTRHTRCDVGSAGQHTSWPSSQHRARSASTGARNPATGRLPLFPGGCCVNTRVGCPDAWRLLHKPVREPVRRSIVGQQSSVRALRHVGQRHPAFGAPRSHRCSATSCWLFTQ